MPGLNRGRDTAYGGVTGLLKDAIKDAEALLDEAGVEEPRLTAEALMAVALSTDRAGVVSRLRDAIAGRDKDKFEALVKRRAAREPLQYITGEEEFFGRRFRVSPDVLIPRPETELLVETALRLVKGIPRAKAADIGTGSGCIAVALASGAPMLSVYATEQSAGALKVAKQNAAENGVEDSILFLRGDLFGPLLDAGLEGKLDLVATNPPYIPSDELAGLQPEVRFEPTAALDGGPDGLDTLRRIIRQAPALLKKGGHLVMEIGFGQADAARGLIKEQPGLELVKMEKDFVGIERVVVAKMT